MSSIKRRHFLQSSGAMLAAVGLSQFDLVQQADRYGKLLAQGSPGRKLALLVGINTYQGGIRNLAGSLTDLELQWHLLVHRFGFNPKDILIVADNPLDGIDAQPLLPTRENILGAFEQHLIRQAKAGDTVVFHYSGHGALVRDRSAQPQFIQNGKGVNGTIVPRNSLPEMGKPTYVQDIMGRTIFLLTKSLKTDNVSVILDSCHSGGGTRGNLTYRAAETRLSDRLSDEPSPEELDYQNRLLKDNKLTEATFETLRSNIAKGVAIGAANYTQYAAEASFDNDRFRAGAFTYLLTRYLWQMSGGQSVETIFDKLRLSTTDLASLNGGWVQVPEVKANPQRNDQQPILFLKPTTPWADAVVRSSNNGEIQFWLGGISTLSLEANSKDSVFSVLDTQLKEVAQIQQTRREKLVGYGRLIKGSATDARPGALLREVIRGIDPNPVLRVGLDASLGKDLGAAKTIFKAIDRVEIVPIQQAKYVLGRMTASDRSPKGTTNLPKVGKAGLFLAEGLRPIEGSFEEREGTIEDLINRLRPRFKSLLAAQILKSITGSDITTASRATSLKLSSGLIPVNGQSNGSAIIKRFKANTQVQLKLMNNDSQNLYVAALSINSDGSLTFLHPVASDAPTDAALLEKGRTLLASQKITLTPPAGYFELLTIASTQPIRNALIALQRIAPADGSGTRTVEGEQSLEVIGDLLGDFDLNARAGLRVLRDVARIKTSEISAISTIVQVVE